MNDPMKELYGHNTSCNWWIPKEEVQLEFNFTPELHNTTVETKKEYFHKFAELIENQFKHGGDKYKLEGFRDREATDVIQSIVPNWVEGTMLKYIFRWINFRREKDLLKIATYCYILWLKYGNHLTEKHDEDVKQ